MNYWERWIGDWKRKTTHLSFEEKGAYGELLDHLYSHDVFSIPSKEAAYRVSGAQTASERKAVDSVLAQFFTHDDAGFHQKRTMEELTKRATYQEQQRERANKRWHKTEPEKTEEPKNGRVARTPQEQVILPDWLNADSWRDWLMIRPAKARTVHAQKAALAKLERFRLEGHDANQIVQDSLANGWQGLFKPDAKNRKGASLADRNQAAVDEFLKRGETRVFDGDFREENDDDAH